MKRKVRFELKNVNAKNTSAINMIYSWGYKDERGKYQSLKYSTGESVNPTDWEDQQAEGAYSASINNELNTIKNAADKLFLILIDEGLTPELFKQELDIKLERAESKPEPVIKKQYIDPYLNKYIKDIETGARRNFRDPIKKFAPGTIRNFRAFRTKFKEYEKETGKQFTFDNINMKFYRSFIAWLDKSHTINTTGKAIKQLKMIMQAAFDDDVHTTMEFKKKGFKVVTELVDTIYLDEKEIETIYSHKVTGVHGKARDLFMVGFFTAQRVSDWRQINKENIGKSPNGTRIISIVQKKTGTQVVIPLTDPRFIAILEKYDYELPKMPDQKINDYIKIVCKDAKITDKASLVTTHTARRSACTNMYNAGIPIGKIMKISGHKTESEFKKYIRVTDEENAEDLATHSYYTRKHDKT